jgi:hypothetical protein
MEKIMAKNSKSHPNNSKSGQKSKQPVKKTGSSTQYRNKPGKPIKKERGFWLIFALVLMALHGIVAAYFFTTAKQGAVPNAHTLVVPNSHTWVLSLMIAHCVLDVIAAVGIWFWQKWALYVYAFSTILAVIAGLMTGYGMYSVFYMALPAIIIGWLLRTKWQYFD